MCRRSLQRVVSEGRQRGEPSLDEGAGVLVWGGGGAGQTEWPWGEGRSLSSSASVTSIPRWLLGQLSTPQVAPLLHQGNVGATTL